MGDSMFIALDSTGKRVDSYEAETGESYYCPICGEKVIIRSGQIRERHFSHKAGVCTDTWNYDMSEWHRHKQSFFSKEYQEVVVSFQGVKHRADILKDIIVIEFQHSSISVDKFCDRNDFYTSLGFKIAWVFDVTEQRENGALYYVDLKNNREMMRWKNPLKVLQYGPTPKDDNKDIAIWLAWDDDAFGDSLYKVIWSS